MNYVNSRPKFDYLDGLRGVCAVFVALYHAQLFTGNGFQLEQLSIFFKPLSYIISFGHFSVAVFIVLSGFCLTIPVALSSEKQLRGGFVTYISRRAKRILPPYYIALLLVILLIFLIPILRIPMNTAWDSKIPVTIGGVISHLLMIHNLNPDWVFKIDGPMWSVATEWQIYFFFPLLLLIWRKINLYASLAVSIVLGLIPYALFKSLGIAHPWYLGLFGMGMGAAAITFSEEPAFIKIKAFLISKIFFYISLFLMSLMLVISSFKNVHPIITETYVGFVISLLLIKFTSIEKNLFTKENGVEKPLFLKFLNHFLVVKLGTFSYSIYLIHAPLLALFNLIMIKTAAISLEMRLAYMLMIAVPAAVCIAYIFHLFFERKFMTSPKKSKSTQINRDEQFILVKND